MNILLLALCIAAILVILLETEVILSYLRVLRLDRLFGIPKRTLRLTDFIRTKSVFLADLLNCGVCLSWWISIILSVLVGISPWYYFLAVQFLALLFYSYIAILWRKLHQ